MSKAAPDEEDKGRAHESPADEGEWVKLDMKASSLV